MVAFFIVNFYGLVVTGEIQNISKKIFAPKTIQIKAHSSIPKPPVRSFFHTIYTQKTIKESIQGYNEKEIQRLLDIASAQ